MAIPPGYVDIPKVSDPQNYIEELFGAGDESMPSFFDYLERRGLSKETFTPENYLQAALASELMNYTAIVSRMQQQRSETNPFSRMSLNDLKASAQMLSKQLRQVEESISKAANAE